MAWNKKDKEEEKSSDLEVFSKADYDYLREGMKRFAAKKIHGRMYGAWEQFMAEIGVLSFSEAGYLSVSNPYLYTKWNDVLSKIEWADWKEQEKLFESFPDAKNVWWEKRHGIFNEIRGLLQNWKVGTTP